MFEINSLVVARINRSSVLAAGLSALFLSGCAQLQQQMQQPGYYNLPAASSATDALAQAESSYANQTIRAPNQIQFDLRQPASQNTAGAPASAGSASAASSKPVSSASSAQPVPSNVAAGKNNTSAQPALKPYDASGAPNDLPPADLSTTQNVIANSTGSGSSIQENLMPEPQTFSGTLPCFHPEMKCSAQRITLSLAPNGRWRARAAYLEQNTQNGGVQVDQGCWRGNMMNPPRIILLNTQGDVRAELAMTNGNSLRLVSLNGANPNLTYTLSRQPDLDAISELDKKAAPNCP